MFRQQSIDAFLSSDFTELHIDEDKYMGQTNRSRFTFAHEVGHIVMHKDVVVKASSIDEWKRIILQAGSGRDMYESQANDFAGCLLMPRDLLLEEFEKCKQTAKKEFAANQMTMPDDLTLISFFASKIAPVFDVSIQAAEIRLSKAIKNNK